MNEQEFYEKAEKMVAKTKKIRELIDSIKYKFPRCRYDTSHFIRHGINYNVVSKNNEFYSGSFENQEILFELSSEINLVIDLGSETPLNCGIVLKKNLFEKIFISFDEFVSLSDESNLDKLSELISELEAKISKVSDANKQNEERYREQKRNLIKKLF